MNHKTASITKDYKTATALVVVAAIAAVLIASTAAVGTGHVALADNGNKTKGNDEGKKFDGISIPTKTQQKQECQTAGGTSPISLSCTAVSTNTVTNGGGVLSDK